MVTIASTGTQNAVANGDTRTLSFYHLHTKESLTVTFKRNGQYDAAALKQVNWFMRDWRKNQQTTMEPRLLDIIWEVYRDVGGRQAVNIVCGYRSPGTNEMLRSRTRGVAKFSQHTLGRAMDFFIPGVPLSSLREAGIRLERGGVGYYPTSGSPFVHLDVGNVRAWPRMTRAQLARIFPDGRTVHLPAEGGKMPGYQLALADIKARGATVSRAWNASPPGTAEVADTSSAASGKKRNFLARLLGMDEGDDGDEAAPAETGREKPAVAKSAPAAAPAPVEPEPEAPAAVVAAAKPAVVPIPLPAPIAKQPTVVALADPAPLPAQRSAAVEPPASVERVAFADTGNLPPPPLPADPSEPPPVPPRPGLVWVQGPQGVEMPAASVSSPAQTLSPAAVARTTDVVVLPSAAIPVPRPKPGMPAAGVQVAAADVSSETAASSRAMAPQPALRRSAQGGIGIASRIASAYAEVAPARTTTPAANAAPTRTANALGLASRIATANAAVQPVGRPNAADVTASIGAASGGKLPENFAEQAHQRLSERTALAYASPNLLMASTRTHASAAVMPVALNRSIALAAPRPPVRNARLVTVKLDRKGWQDACRPERARGDALAAEERAPSAEVEPALLAAPGDALPFGFGADPSYGTKADRFAGSPVMLIRTVKFTRSGNSLTLD